MSGDAYCLLAVVLSLAVLCAMVVLVRGMPRVSLFDNWAAVITAWRQTRDLFEKLLLLFVLLRQLSKGFAVTLAIATISTAATIGTSLCGVNPEFLRVVREIMNDILRSLGGEPGPLPLPAGPSATNPVGR